MPLDPKHTDVHLSPTGEATRLPGGNQLWSLPEPNIERYALAWFSSGYEFTSGWPTWEMRPNTDEFVHLLSGSVALPLERRVGITKSLAHETPRSTT